ncbi:acetyl-CoA carboxylase [Kosakonia sp. BK9b]
MDDNKITLRQLRALARALRATTINCIELTGENWSLRMTSAPPSPVLMAPVATVESPEIRTPLCAPAPGRVLLRHPLLADDFAGAGAHVTRHQLLALLQVGGLYLPLRSPAEGMVSFALSHNDTVEFDEEILSIHKDSKVRAGL